MSAAAKYEPIATADPDARPPVRYHCEICNKFNCDHWDIENLQILINSGTWWLFGGKTINGRLRCVTCDKIVHSGQLNIGTAITCQRDPRHRFEYALPVLQEQPKPAPQKRPGPVTGAKTTATATDTKTTDTKPISADTKTTTIADMKTKTTATDTKALNVENETLMCVECVIKFTPHTPCRHWSIGKNADGSHLNLWCASCDSGHEKPPFMSSRGGRTHWLSCYRCKHQVVFGAQHCVGGDWNLIDATPRDACKKCEGSGWMIVPTYANCPACVGTGGIPCTHTSGDQACTCDAGYKKKCRVCEGARVLEKAKLAPVKCPFCKVE